MSLADQLKSVDWTPLGCPLPLRPELLLAPNVPKPLHRTAPRVVLGEAWWNQTREAAYASTNYHCLACGVYKGAAKFHKWLEGHEVYKIDYKKGRAVYIETVPLCYSCHCFIHDGRMEAMVEKGKMKFETYDAIMDHGKAILKAAKLRKRLRTIGQIAPWDKWRLVIDGKEYKGKYENYEAWLKDHNVDTIS